MVAPRGQPPVCGKRSSLSNGARPRAGAQRGLMRNHPDAEVLLSVLGLDGPGRPARGDFGDGSGVQFVGADRRDEPRLGDQPTCVAFGRRFRRRRTTREPARFPSSAATRAPMSAPKGRAHQKQDCTPVVATRRRAHRTTKGQACAHNSRLVSPTLRAPTQGRPSVNTHGPS